MEDDSDVLYLTGAWRLANVAAISDRLRELGLHARTRFAARQPKFAEIIARLKAERDAKKGVTAVDAEAAVSEIFG